MTLEIAPQFCPVAAEPLRRLESGQHLPFAGACPRPMLFSSPAGLVLPEANFLEPYGGIKQAMGKWPVLRCLTYDCVD